MNKIDNNTILDKYKEISKLNIEEVYTKYNTSSSGLSNSEVNKRIKEYGKNIVIITAADLNLKGDIINPISNETITKSTVKIEITLNKDYTAKSVSVSGISCDVK